MKTNARIVAAGLLAAVSLTVAPTLCAQVYRIVDLGDLPGGSDSSDANTLNDVGQVLGRTSVASGSTIFLWDATNGMRDLGKPTANETGVSDINNSGVVVGRSGNYYTFRWDATNGFQPLAAGVYPYNAAIAINDGGAIAFSSWSYYGPPGKAYLQVGTSRTWLGELTPGAWTRGFSINNQNEIAGSSHDSSYSADGYHVGLQQGFRWNPATGIQALGSLPPYTNCTPTAINNASQIVGYCYCEPRPFAADPYTAFLWTTNGGMVALGASNLGMSNTAANAINDAGIVVGQGKINGTSHALIWDAQHNVSDLNDRILDKSGWTMLGGASGINSSGMIAGSGLRTNGVWHAFVLYPMPVAPSITQQPSNQVVRVGTACGFTVAASGTDPITYQWLLNGTPIVGATNAGFAISTAGVANVGTYTVAITNAAGGLVSDAARLILDDLKMYAGVKVYGTPGSAVRVDYTTNLNILPVPWNVLTNMTLQRLPEVFIDYGSEDQPHRFYRTVPQ